MKRINVLSLLLLMSAVSLYSAAPAGGGAGDDRRGKKIENNSQDFDGLPINIGSLRFAIDSKNSGMVKYIIDQNQELLGIPDIEYPYDVAPLHIAAERGRKEVVEVLLAAGADVNAQIEKGYTPLLIAAHFERKEIVEMLLASGADVNAKISSHVTSLYIAAQYGQKEIVEILMAHGGRIGRMKYEDLVLVPGKQKMVKDIWKKLYKTKQFYVLQTIQQVAGRDIAEGEEADIQRSFIALPPEILMHIVQFGAESESEWETFLNKLP